MRAHIYHAKASMSFDRLGAIGREMKKSPLVWALCRGNKRSLPSLCREYRFLDDQTAFSLTGFFVPIDAVLQTISSTVVGGVELTDVMQSCESRGRGAKSQIAPDEQVTRVICVVTGLRRRAVADADSSDCSVNRIAGIGCRTGMQVGDRV